MGFLKSGFYKKMEKALGGSFTKKTTTPSFNCKQRYFLWLYLCVPCKKKHCINLMGGRGQRKMTKGEKCKIKYDIFYKEAAGGSRGGGGLNAPYLHHVLGI